MLIFDSNCQQFSVSNILWIFLFSCQLYSIACLDADCVNPNGIIGKCTSRCLCPKQVINHNDQFVCCINETIREHDFWQQQGPYKHSYQKSMHLKETEDEKYSCINPNCNRGICRSIYDCPSLLSVLQTPEASTEFIILSLCKEGTGKFPFVCCTADTEYLGSPKTTKKPTKGVSTPPANVSPSNGMGNVLPQPPDCGPLSRTNKIFGGSDTALDQYPWMVNLIRVDKYGRLYPACSGSLINQRYVLTAAHCISQNLIGVRLGEYDTSKEIDCVGSYCNQKPLHVDIEEVIIYRQRDVALIRLAVDVEYTDFIRPVCLPLRAKGKQIPAGEMLTVAGWGVTTSTCGTDKKKHVKVPVHDFKDCQRMFKLLKVNIIESQICAGGVLEEDSCQGDSGGPLMRINHGRWHLEGIVSFGMQCGLKGWPAIYERVTSYIDWIQANMRP